MDTYTASKLNATTTQAEQTKLIKALKAVHGVENATLHLSESRVEVAPRVNETARRVDIETAASKCGFSLDAT